MNTTLYREGQIWRVQSDAAKLTGMKPSGPYAQSGWRQTLKRGDILTCGGEKWTFGDGVPAITWMGPRGEWLANDCTLSPSVGSLWNQRPAPGILMPWSKEAQDWYTCNGAITERSLFEQDLRSSWSDEALQEDVNTLLARVNATQGAWILWDPEDDGNGYFLTGNDPFALAKQALQDFPEMAF